MHQLLLGNEWLSCPLLARGFRGCGAGGARPEAIREEPETASPWLAQSM